MARIVGKDALPALQRFTLVCAELINEAFLRQSALSPIDAFATPERQAAMLQLLGRFIDLFEPAVAAGVAPEQFMGTKEYRRLLRLNEQRLEDFAELEEQLEIAVRNLHDEQPETEIP